MANLHNQDGDIKMRHITSKYISHYEISFRLQSDAEQDYALSRYTHIDWHSKEQRTERLTRQRPN